ncbi:arylesterase [Ferrovum sp.]|uniref:arylesterase n=1 Tax=Ferrovum sp. TaxID=2609467 RepID=UPI002624BA58|nr:arylesterase [Ferrovum sp.]
MHLAKYFWLICLFFAIPACATSHAPVILVFGDSLSAGYGLAAHEAWPDLLQQRLRHASTTAHWNVVNASISGETSAGGLDRLPVALLQHHPAIVILELGANDGLQGLSIEALRSNLTTMIHLIGAAHARTLLVGIRLPSNYGMSWNEKLQHMYADLAHQQHIPLLPSLLDGIETRPELFQADGMHPLAQSENQVLDNVWGELRTMLRDQAVP